MKTFPLLVVTSLVVPLVLYFIPVPYSYLRYLSDSKYKALLKTRPTSHSRDIPRVPHDMSRSEFFEKHFLFGDPVIIEAPLNTSSHLVSPELTPSFLLSKEVRRAGSQQLVDLF